MGIIAPMIPIAIPSTKNGALTNASVAPINFIIEISSLRTVIPMTIVLVIRKMETASRIIITAIATYPTSFAALDRPLAVASERLT